MTIVLDLSQRRHDIFGNQSTSVVPLRNSIDDFNCLSENRKKAGAAAMPHKSAESGIDMRRERHLKRPNSSKICGFRRELFPWSISLSERTTFVLRHRVAKPTTEVVKSPKHKDGQPVESAPACISPSYPHR